MDENTSMQILELEQKISDLSFEINRSTLYKNIIKSEGLDALHLYVGPVSINRLLSKAHLDHIRKATIIYLEDYLPVLEQQRNDTEKILSTLILGS
jgi:hypothetical protein